MNSKFIDYDTAHVVVERNQSLFWDGWDIVEWRPSKDAFYKKNAMFRNGRWGLAKRYSPGNNGWKVPSKYVGE